MEKISIARPFGSRNIGMIIQNVGIVERVYQQGDKDICVVRQGDFGVINQTVEAPIVEQVKVEQKVVIKPKSKKTIQVAPESKNKQLLDQTPNKDNKVLLRG